MMSRKRDNSHTENKLMNLTIKKLFGEKAGRSIKNESKLREAFPESGRLEQVFWFEEMKQR